MNSLIFNNPRRLVFGQASMAQMAEDYCYSGLTRLFVITIPSVLDYLEPVLNTLKSKDVSVKINLSIKSEPTFTTFNQVLSEAKLFKADSVAGIGGGSVMDVAKLIAALLKSKQQLNDIVGIDLLKDRSTFLICIPTTSGTGSEVSPNSILLDEEEGEKKGIISQFLVPDATYIDPVLTLGLPSIVTAYTGIDALTHCIEAYANRFAHPMVDTLALEGIRHISRNLKKAVDNGSDLDARTHVALGSVYGGMCLGPVNTAAVHALAYPLGSNFKIAHGVSNALLLPYVMEFNLPAAEKRYAEIASAMGVEPCKSDLETASAGISFIQTLICDCHMPSHLSSVGIPKEAFGNMANSAMNIKRLLKNNVRELTLNDILTIYEKAY